MRVGILPYPGGTDAYARTLLLSCSHRPRDVLTVTHGVLHGHALTRQDTPQHIPCRTRHRRMTRARPLGPPPTPRSSRASLVTHACLPHGATAIARGRSEAPSAARGLGAKRSDDARPVGGDHSAHDAAHPPSRRIVDRAPTAPSVGPRPPLALARVSSLLARPHPLTAPLFALLPRTHSLTHCVPTFTPVASTAPRHPYPPSPLLSPLAMPLRKGRATARLLCASCCHPPHRPKHLGRGCCARVFLTSADCHGGYERACHASCTKRGCARHPRDRPSHAPAGPAGEAPTAKACALSPTPTHTVRHTRRVPRPACRAHCPMLQGNDAKAPPPRDCRPHLAAHLL